MPKDFDDGIIEIVPIKNVKVKDRFRKELGDLTELVESIKIKGIIQPITIDLKGELIAGERRLRAAELAGLSVIRAIRRKSADQEDKLEIELFENIHRKDFTWQERAALELEIFNVKKAKDPKWSNRRQAKEVHGEDAHSGVNRRLELASMIEHIPELGKAKSEDEAYKMLKKLEEQVITNQLVTEAKAKGVVSLKIADKNYKVGDCIKGLGGLHDDRYNFAEFDPPYAIELDKRKARNEGTADLMDSYNELSNKEYIPFITKVAEQTFRVLRDNSFAVCWYGMSWHSDTLAILRAAGFKVSDIPCIWNKGAQGQTASPDTQLGSSYEPFWLCRKGDAKLSKPGRSNVFSFAPLGPSKKIHPTEKPLDLMVEVLETFSYPGSSIVVPVLGSGVTIRAGFRTGRICFGWDLSKMHKDKFLGNVTRDLENKLYSDNVEELLKKAD